MKIRRYLGSNTQEAILKVKMDLGSDAVILNTRKIRQKGLFKIFAKPMVEILAAVDDDTSHKSVPGKDYSDRKEKAALVNDESERADTHVAQSQSEVAEKYGKVHQLESKVNNLEAILNKIYESIQQPVKNEEQSGCNPAQPVKQQILQQVYNNLVKNGVDIELAKIIIDTTSEKIPESNEINEVSAEVYKTISNILGKPETIKLRSDKKPTVVMFVGPTGVGKTTTLAKLAANYAINLKKEVGLITADTYRIAAVDQLKTYAEIIGIPVTVAYSVSDLKGAMEQYCEKDLIFIDTAGISYRNKSQYDELKALVSVTAADEVYLVLSANISMRNCKDILSNYKFLNNFKLIFTKLDETIENGIILNARHLTENSLSYITTGQSVPDDIELVNIDAITKKLLGA